MKLVLLSDAHFAAETPGCRTDDILKTSMRKLNFILGYADRIKAPIISAGDFFDVPRSWRLLPEVMDVFGAYNDTGLLFVRGQHDNYFYSGASRASTMLGVLEKMDKATYIDGKTPFRYNDIYLYGCDFGGEIPEPTTKRADSILVIHAGIYRNKLYKEQEGMSAKKFTREHGMKYDFILCGDIHQRFDYEDADNDCRIVNTGPIMRLDASIEMIEHEPKFAVYDTDTMGLEWVDIPYEKDVISRQHIERQNQIDANMDDFVSKMEQAEVKGMDFKKNLVDYLKENKIDEDVKSEIFDVIEPKQ